MIENANVTVAITATARGNPHRIKRLTSGARRKLNSAVSAMGIKTTLAKYKITATRVNVASEAKALSLAL